MKFLARALLALVFVTVESTPGICAQQSASQESPGDHLKKANELAGSGNLSGSIAEFRAAIRLDPSNANAHWGLAKALDAKTDQTFPLWSGAVIKEALKEYQSALKLDPKLRDDKTESAERHFQSATGSLGPDFGRWYSRWCGDFSDNWVNHCMDNAAAELRIALLLDPDYVPAHVWLGVVLEKLHKHDAAIEEFRAALRLDPQFADAHLGLGHSLEKKGNLQGALQEYSAALPMEEARTKYEKLSAKLGIKKEQSQPLETEKNGEDHPLAQQSLFVPATASGPTRESNVPAREQAPVPKKTDPEAILRGFKSYYVKSDTIYLHRETLQKELQNRPEFPAWELAATEDSKAADVVITITLPFLTWEWNYRMVHQPTGAELDKGKVSAAVENTAAPQLAAMIVKRIREVRSLPASFQDTQGIPQASPNSSPEKGRSWKVRYISGPAPHLRKDTLVTLTVNREWMTVRNSKTLAFSAPVRYLSAVDSRTEVRKATKGWEDFWDSTGTGETSLIIFVAPIFLAGEGILAPIKTTDHFVNMYWVEDGASKGAEFRVSAGDAKSLLAELNKVTGREAQDLHGSSEERLKLIAERFDASPIVETDRQVNIGWRSLAPGAYRLVVVTRGKNLAEIYFFPANFHGGSFNANDVAANAVVEFERRKTSVESKAAPSVSYREQNGLVTLSQIDTDDLILRFTPIPLGFAK